MLTTPGQLHIGTSGYNYKHWKNVFYPPSIPQKKWLAFYAQHFSTVELNTTFYRKPTVASILAWQAATPPHFRFAVKMRRGITHYRQLIHASDLLHKFLPLLHHLAPSRRGPLLVQLPERMKPNPQRLDAFLADLTAAMDSPGFRVTLEFRNPAWLTPEISAILTAHRAALCLADMPTCPILQPNPAPFVYLRRHGAGENIPCFSGNYTPSQIAADAQHITRWLREGRDVYVYFNNDIGAHALHNARELLAALAPQIPSPQPAQPA